MDETARTGRRAWAAPPRVVAGQAAGALAAAVAAALSDDPAGRLLAVTAALVLLGLAARDLVVRPVLAVEEGGLLVAEGLRRRRVPWPEVEAVRVDVSRRRGLTSRLLEVDLGEHLVLLPARRLGADPDDVAAAVLAHRPPTGS